MRKNQKTDVRRIEGERVTIIKHDFRVYRFLTFVNNQSIEVRSYSPHDYTPIREAIKNAKNC